VDRLTCAFRVELPEPSTYILDGDRITAKTVTVTPGPVLDYLSA
jgi:hypothetical protein